MKYVVYFKTNMRKEIMNILECLSTRWCLIFHFFKMNCENSLRKRGRSQLQERTEKKDWNLNHLFSLKKKKVAATTEPTISTS